MQTKVPDYVEQIIIELCNKNIEAQKLGFGPFSAAICDGNGTIIAQNNNSVINDNCSICHAEINVIKQVQNKYQTYNLSSYNLSILITSEPCMMCLGAIMWSGIKNIYFGISSKEVEKITGFDEGYKPNWIENFEKKGIKAIGNIQPDLCKQVLLNYVNSGKIIYSPR